MIQRILGVQISSENIKLLETTRKNGGNLNVERCKLIQTPPNSVQNGMVTDIDALKEAIQTELAGNGFKAKQCVVVFESTDTINRAAVINKQADKAIKALLDAKPEDYLPIQGSEYQVDYKVVREFKDDTGQAKMELMLVAVPNTIISPIIKLMDALKLDIARITIPSEALIKVFNQNTGMIPNLPDECGVLNVGGLTTSVTFIHKGQANFYKNVEFGAIAYDNLLQESYLTSDVTHMPQELKSQYDAQVRDVAYPFIESRLIRPLERLIQFYATRFSQGAMETLYIVGTGARVEYLDKYVSEAIGVPVIKLNTLENITAHELTKFNESNPYFVDILGAINGL